MAKGARVQGPPAAQWGVAGRFLKKSPLFVHRGVRFRGTLEPLLPGELYLQRVITAR